STGWRVGAFTVRVARKAAWPIWIEIAAGFCHLHGLRGYIQHHGSFDFVGVRAAGLAQFFLDGTFASEIGIAEENAVCFEIRGSLPQRPEGRDAGVKDVKAARPVVCERADDLGDHCASSFKTERSRARIFEERGIEAVVDDGSDDDVLSAGIE